MKLWKWATKPTLSFIELIVILAATAVLNDFHPWWLSDVITFGVAALAWTVAWLIPPRGFRHHKNATTGG